MRGSLIGLLASGAAVGATSLNYHLVNKFAEMGDQYTSDLFTGGVIVCTSASVTFLMVSLSEYLKERKNYSKLPN